MKPEIYIDGKPQNEICDFPFLPQDKTADGPRLSEVFQSEWVIPLAGETAQIFKRLAIAHIVAGEHWHLYRLAKYHPRRRIRKKNLKRLTQLCKKEEARI